MSEKTGRRLLQLGVHLLAAVPMAWLAYELFAGRIRGEWIKEITHRTGFWGLTFITLSLAVSPLRRHVGLNALQPLRRPLGLWGFAYIATHFLIYFVLDRAIPFEGLPAVREVATDVAKRPYITVGFGAFLMLIPLAVTSTKGWIRRMGKRWTALHALVYVIALAGVVHFSWAVKADQQQPAVFGAILAVLLAARLVPAGAGLRRRAAAPPATPRSGRSDRAAEATV
jgi:sulfoxide reductase heme-binding subunit YedZ